MNLFVVGFVPSKYKYDQSVDGIKALMDYPNLNIYAIKRKDDTGRIAFVVEHAKQSAEDVLRYGSDRFTLIYNRDGKNFSMIMAILPDCLMNSVKESGMELSPGDRCIFVNKYFQFFGEDSELTVKSFSDGVDSAEIVFIDILDIINRKEILDAYVIGSVPMSPLSEVMNRMSFELTTPDETLN